jgi:hypothetical protein
MASSLTLKSILLLAPFLSNAVAVPSQKLSIRSTKPQAFQAPAPNVATSNYIALTRRPGKSPSAPFVTALLGRGGMVLQSSDNPLISISGGVEYLTPINFNDEQVEVIVDTGSSDTWLIASDFQCIDANSIPKTQATCNFGPLYNGTFGDKKKKDVNFNIAYGDGEFVTGDFGYADITIAGITVPGQQVSLLVPLPSISLN